MFVVNTVALIRGEDGAPRFLASTVQDITEHKRMEFELEHLALHDSLTDLPNRALLHDRLEHALERAVRSDERVAVIFIDVDQFKAVNDSRGHGAGDEVLRGIASRLAGTLRDAGTIARLRSLLPVDVVKIDREFIARLPDDEDDRAVLTAVVAMARSLRLTAVAEGVERAAQRHALEGLGCTFAQGYHFARPLTPAAMEDLLRRDVRLGEIERRSISPSGTAPGSSPP